MLWPMGPHIIEENSAAVFVLVVKYLCAADGAAGIGSKKARDRATIGAGVMKELKIGIDPPDTRESIPVKSLNLVPGNPILVAVCFGSVMALAIKSRHRDHLARFGPEGVNL